MCSFAFGPIVLLIIASVVILPVALICMLLARGTRRPAVPAAQPATTVNPAERNRRREAILEKLAAKEISREDAEQQLVELDKPLPEQMPVPPPQTNKGCGGGCLVATICLIIVLALLLLAVFLPAVVHSKQSVEHQMIRIEEAR